MDKKRTVIKWYKKLGFPKRYDEEFEELLSKDSLEINKDFSKNPEENFLSALYQCETLEQRYTEMGIDQSILYNTLSDIKIWTDVWYGLSGKLGLKETGWIKNHLSGKLFRLGRLQFCMGRALLDIHGYDVRQNDPVIEIHIPAEEKMRIEDCKSSIAQARLFFSKFFPEYKYGCITCHSWLLDKNLAVFLGENSNILKFQNLFDVTSVEESDALLKYVFGWGVVRNNLQQYEGTSGFSRKIKNYVLNGGVLFVGYGVLKL